MSPNTYTMTSQGYRYTFTVPANGWSSLSPNGGIVQGDELNDPPDFAAFVTWDDPQFVYEDPCQWAGTDIETGATPDEFAQALGTALDEMSPTTPTEETVDGNAALRMQITVPADAVLGDCVQEEYSSFEGRYYQGPGQVDDLWIIGLPNGDRRVVFSSYMPGTPDHVRTEMDQMIDSMTIEPI